MKRAISILSLLILSFSVLLPAICVTAESDWILLGTDGDEGGTKNDWRDVQASSYIFSVDGKNVSLRLDCYGDVGSAWPKTGGRYKWFIDVTNPTDMYLSGGNIGGADYLFYVEDSDDDGSGDMYLVVDTTSDGSFNDELILPVPDEFYDLEGTSISMTIPLALIGNPKTFAVTWATDQEDPNMNAAPNNDRVDGKTGIAGQIFVPFVQITVNTIVVDEVPSSNWKYTISGPENYTDSFLSPPEGSSPTWVSGEDFIPGNYTVEIKTKFGYYLTVDIQGDSDGGSVIDDSKVIVDLDKGELISLSFKNTFLPAFTVSLDSAPPADLDYNLPPLNLTLVQSAWSTDINEDGRVDLVLDKPTAVVLNFTGVEVSSTVSVSVNLGGIVPDTITKTAAELADNNIFSFCPLIPDTPGDITLTGTYSVDNGPTVDLNVVSVTVKETTSPPIAYSYLYHVDRKGNLDGYQDISLENYLQTAGNSTYILNTTYPVSSISVDESYVGLEGASVSRKDAFKALLTDALAVAQEAQLRMGGTAIGIGIGPNNPDPAIVDYFTYHGFSGAAGISFGPSVKGVLILDGYYGGSAHEVAHTFGLYYGEPEEYQTSPLYGIVTSGVRVETGDWMTGYDFMGAVAYGTLDDTWVDSTTFAELFKEFVNAPNDPEILLASAIINSNGTVEFPNTWYALDEGFPDRDTSGNYTLVFVGENNETITQTSFDARFEVQIGGYPGVLPGTDGDLINQTAFSAMPTDSTGFSLVMEYPAGTAEVQIWNMTDANDPQKLGVMDADDIVHLQNYDVESWTTCSSFVNTTSLDANFKKDGKTKTSTLVSTNPGTIYLNLLVENNEDHLIAPKIKITLPGTVDSLGELVSPAFELKGATPIHVYSDLARLNEVTQDAGITIEGNTIILNLNIPEDGLAYVTIHLDYTLKGTEGWPFDAGQEYFADLPFGIFAPHITEGGNVITDLVVPFEVIGSENT